MVQEDKQCEDDYYQKASSQTQDLIQKHKTKELLALPNSISELLL